jgi:hypothetical protein
MHHLFLLMSSKNIPFVHDTLWKSQVCQLTGQVSNKHASCVVKASRVLATPSLAASLAASLAESRIFGSSPPIA